MKKQLADKKIFEYRDKIFGFAMEKMRSIDQARELASDIVYEVYLSFLRADNIANLDGYVYRIARNVWAQYIHKLETGREFCSISDITIAAPVDTSEEEAETIAALRREIGYLSERQRLVIYMHYYDKLSVENIARRLNISPGTVKWHLSDARTKLKAGIDMNINEQNLEINPIKFIKMGHSGSAGSKGDTADFFDTRLKQNIAWACYYEPKTLAEIARAVGVPQVYVADVLDQLVDYAFIDKVDNSKNPHYLTNMVITDARKTDGSDAEGISLDTAADVLCEKYFPKILSDFEASPDHWGMSCDGGDVNFMKYSVIMMAINALFQTDINEAYNKVAVKRPDGGCYIAYATVADDSYTPSSNKYWSCGMMTRNNYGDDPKLNCNVYSVDCCYSDRTGGWRDNPGEDWKWLTKFISYGKNSLSPEEYKRLLDKGYVYEDRVQPVIVKADTDEKLKEFFLHYLKDKITISDEVTQLSKQIDRENFERDKKSYPKQVHDVIKLWDTDIIGGMTMLPRVIEKLLEKGLLEPLTDIQKKSVFSILCIQE